MTSNKSRNFNKFNKILTQNTISTSNFFKLFYKRNMQIYLPLSTCSQAAVYSCMPSRQVSSRRPAGNLTQFLDTRTYNIDQYSKEDPAFFRRITTYHTIIYNVTCRNNTKLLTILLTFLTFLL